jgi:DNA-binding beta-propeller fold protein YncE
MYVADGNNSRVVVFNSVPTSNGAIADNVLGKPSLVASGTSCAANGMNTPTSVFTHGGRLFVSDMNNHRILIWNSLPVGSAVSADVVLGQPNMTTCTQASGLGGLKQPRAVWTDGNRLFVSDSGNNRILYWNSIPATNGVPADGVIGQPDNTSAVANNGGLSAQTLSSPSGLVRALGRLWIADQTNNRVIGIFPP